MNICRLFQYDNSEDEEDLLAHLAKRRAARKIDFKHNLSYNQDQQGSNLFMRGDSDSGKTLNREQVPASKEVRAGGYGDLQKKRHQKFEARAQAEDFPADKELFLCLNAPEGCHSIKDGTQFPLTRAPKESSPLFVQRDADVISTTTSAQSRLNPRLLPSEYRSSPEKIATQHQGACSGTRSSIQDLAQGATVADPRPSLEFVRSSMRQNPYLSGVFSYKGLSRKEALAKIDYQVSNGRKRKREAMSEGTQQPIKAVTNSPDLAAKPEYKRHTTRAPSVQANARASGNREPHDSAPLATTKLEPNSMVVDLREFLSKRIRNCKATLAKLGGDQPIDQQAGHVLATHMRTDIDKLARVFHNDSSSAQLFKTAVSSWEMAFMHRATMHRYVAYAMLLERIQQRREN